MGDINLNELKQQINDLKQQRKELLKKWCKVPLKDINEIKDKEYFDSDTILWDELIEKQKALKKLREKIRYNEKKESIKMYNRERYQNDEGVRFRAKVRYENNKNAIKKYNRERYYQNKQNI